MYKKNYNAYSKLNQNQKKKMYNCSGTSLQYIYKLTKICFKKIL